MKPLVPHFRRWKTRVARGIVHGAMVQIGLLLLAMFSLAPNAWAQTNPELVTGARIRVTPLGEKPLTGTFQGFGPAGLSFSDQTGNLRSLSNESIQRLDLAAGRNRLKAALIGGAAGFVAGLLIGAATSGDCVGDCDDPYGVGGGGLVEASATASGAILGGLVFGGVGAAIGAVFFAPERWRVVEFRAAVPFGE